MKNPLEYYKKHSGIYAIAVQDFTNKMTLFSMYRITVFGLVVFGVYLSFPQWQVAGFIATIGIAVFLYLLSRYNNLKSQRAFNKALVEINEEEIRIASGDFFHRDKGLQYQDSNHFYALDIDLFGRGSFFQFINRTTINEGTQKLANTLKANHIEGIKERQEAIKELSSKSQWRQYYSATSSLVKVETPAKQIINWLQNHKSFLPKHMGWLPIAFSLASVTIIVLICLGVITKQELIGYWLLVGLGITGPYLKKINVLASNIDKVRDTFRQYASLLDLIENESFSSKLLTQKQQQIKMGNEKASHIFKTFFTYGQQCENWVVYDHVLFEHCTLL